MSSTALPSHSVSSCLRQQRCDGDTVAVAVLKGWVRAVLEVRNLGMKNHGVQRLAFRALCPDREVLC